MKKLLVLLLIPFLTNVNAQSPTWAWGYGAGGLGNDLAYGISTTATGESYVTGRFNGTATFGSFSVTSYAGPDIFLAKYNTSGTCIWVQHAGSLDGQDPYGDEGRGAGVDAAGNCYITGNFKGVATFGSQTLGTGSMREIYVVKYDPNGNVLWARCPSGGMSNNYSKAITVDGAGNSWITGYLGGGSNTFGAFTINGPGGFVVKYDPNGNVVFATKLGVNGAIDLNGITHDNSGNSFATGYLQTSETIGSNTFTSNGMRDAILIKVDAAGSFSWLRQSWTLPGSVTWSNAVCCDQNGNAYFTGNYENTTIFGNDTLLLSSSFSKDLFIAKYDTNGNELWAIQSDILGSFSSWLDGMAITSDLFSDIYLTGVYSEDVVFGADTLFNNGNGTNTFIAKFDAAGVCQYAIGSTGQNPGAFGHGISTDNFGSVYIAGFDKSNVIFGSYSTVFYGAEDVFVAKIGSHVKSGIAEMHPTNQVSFYLEDEHTGRLNLTNIEANTRFQLYDMAGRLILDVPVTSLNQQINLNELASGIYSWTVTDSQYRIGAGKIVR
jgi:hypothetical protein